MQIEIKDLRERSKESIRTSSSSSSTNSHGFLPKELKNINNDIKNQLGVIDQINDEMKDKMKNMRRLSEIHKADINDEGQLIAFENLKNTLNVNSFRNINYIQKNEESKKNIDKNGTDLNQRIPDKISSNSNQEKNNEDYKNLIQKGNDIMDGLRATIKQEESEREEIIETNQINENGLNCKLVEALEKSQNAGLLRRNSRANELSSYLRKGTREYIPKNKDGFQTPEELLKDIPGGVESKRSIRVPNFTCNILKKDTATIKTSSSSDLSSGRTINNDDIKVKPRKDFEGKFVKGIYNSEKYIE